MQEWQLQQVKRLLSMLRDTSAYYQELLRDVPIESIDSLARFGEMVPSIDRETFRSNQAIIRSINWQTFRTTAARTSGTTGSALQFLHESADSIREHAAICHQWSRIGYRPGTSMRAEFRGIPKGDRRFELFPERPMIRFPILTLRETEVRFFADKCREYRVEFLHGYPSAIHLVAESVLSHGIVFPQPKGIMLASEEVHPWQIARVRQAFPNAKLFAHYGCAERTVLAGWCESSMDYHVMPQYGLVESDPTTSELVTTNLVNVVNGFLRYRMSDTAGAVTWNPCPHCHRPYLPLIGTLSGRTEDYLFTSSRGWISPALLTHPLKGLSEVREIRFVQANPDQVTMEYTAGSRATADALEREVLGITNGVRQILGSSCRLEAKRVDDFPRTASGKFKWIVSSLERGGSLEQEAR